MRTRKPRLLSLIILLAAAGLAAGPGTGGLTGSAQAATAPRPVAGGTLTIAYVPFATHIDVNAANISTLNEVALYFYETLFDRDGSGKLVPLLAKEEQVSPDGLAVTLKLQTGVRFHDGVPFNAAAVKWNLERKIQKKQPLNDVLPIRSVEEVDALTVRINLTRPAPSLKAFLSDKTFSMYSPAFVERVGDNALKQQASGTGPFTVAEFRPNEVLRLKKNPNYWQKDLPYLDEVIFRIVPDINARATMLQAGDADMALALSAPDIEKLKTMRGFRVLRQMGSHQYYITINTRKPPLDDVRVRRALNHAVDKAGIIKTVLLGNAIPATAPYINATVDGYARAGVYAYDPERAKTLLDEAGWKVGTGGIRQKDGKRLSLELITRKGAVPGDFESAELIQGMLRAIGIDARLAVLESATFISRVTKPPEQADYDLVNFSVNIFAGDAEFVMRTFYHTSAFAPKYYNRAYYSSPQVDRWIDESARAVTRAERDRLYARIIKQVFDDAPIIQLVDAFQLAAIRDTVHGVYLAGAQNNWPAKYAWKEKR
ncbi:MAG: hypothetical protein HY660_01125 [Armatimonadetes bacterium]|nr:hypothetical protein [Armatimonadota bacterium]